MLHTRGNPGVVVFKVGRHVGVAGENASGGYTTPARHRLSRECTGGCTARHIVVFVLEGVADGGCTGGYTQMAAPARHRLSGGCTGGYPNGSPGTSSS